MRKLTSPLAKEIMSISAGENKNKVSETSVVPNQPVHLGSLIWMHKSHRYLANWNAQSFMHASANRIVELIDTEKTVCRKCLYLQDIYINQNLLK